MEGAGGEEGAGAGGAEEEGGRLPSTTWEEGGGARRYPQTLEVGYYRRSRVLKERKVTPNPQP